MKGLMQIKRWVSNQLPREVRQWLWRRKVAFGNRQIRKLDRYLMKRIHDAAHEDVAAFEHIDTKMEWERFRDERIVALRRSLRVDKKNFVSPESIITHVLESDGYRIENVVFRGHHDLPVTANIYRPVQSIQKIPLIVIAHSHHAPKSEIELQCMGMTWARQGCAVLIMDLLGHGERRQHPFISSSDYHRPFLVDRQDYYFRSVLSMQVHVVGESLMGWMVQDLRCGVDLLWTDPQIDQDRIILIGSVAGGGDIAAVTGALDDRVSAVVAFNFGHLTTGDWDLTRNLPETARLGFWPWVILASLAPRRLIYGREFSWNSQQDFVWRRLEKVYGLLGKRDALRAVYGSGCGTRHRPIDSHCTNVGNLHRRQLYPIFQEWFGIPIPEQEVIQSAKENVLECVSQETRKVFGMCMVHEVTRSICEKQLTVARVARESQEPEARAMAMQRELVKVLGPMTPILSYRIRSKRQGLGRCEFVVLEVEEDVFVRLQFFLPRDIGNIKLPVVIGLTQEGNAWFRRERRLHIHALLKQGVALCLVEMRGIGDGRHGELYRGRLSPSVGVAATSLMLGESLLSARVRDLRTVMVYLKNCEKLDGNRIGLWGDSLALTNSVDEDLTVPLDVMPFLQRGEPLGSVAALLVALYEPAVQAVYTRGGFVTYASILDEKFVYQPADVIPHGLLKVADLPDIVAALAPRPLCLEGVVDGCNRRVSLQQIEEAYGGARAAYSHTGSPGCLLIENENVPVENFSRWFASYL